MELYDFYIRNIIILRVGRSAFWELHMSAPSSLLPNFPTAPSIAAHATYPLQTGKTQPCKVAMTLVVDLSHDTEYDEPPNACGLDVAIATATGIPATAAATGSGAPHRDPNSGHLIGLRPSNDATGNYPSAERPTWMAGTGRAPFAEQQTWALYGNGTRAKRSLSQGVEGTCGGGGGGGRSAAAPPRPNPHHVRGALTQAYVGAAAARGEQPYDCTPPVGWSGMRLLAGWCVPA